VLFSQASYNENQRCYTFPKNILALPHDCEYKIFAESDLGRSEPKKLKVVSPAQPSGFCMLLRIGDQLYDSTRVTERVRCFSRQIAQLEFKMTDAFGHYITPKYVDPLSISCLVYDFLFFFSSVRFTKNSVPRISVTSNPKKIRLQDFTKDELSFSQLDVVQDIRLLAPRFETPPSLDLEAKAVIGSKTFVSNLYKKPLWFFNLIFFNFCSEFQIATHHSSNSRKNRRNASCSGTKLSAIAIVAGFQLCCLGDKRNRRWQFLSSYFGLLFVCCFFRFSCTDVPLNFRSR
jgi:hypothetical protein